METVTCTALPSDHPMMVAWNKFQSTDEFMTALMWATALHYPNGLRPISDLQREQHAKGSMWLAFTKGMEVIDATLCEQIEHSGSLNVRLVDALERYSAYVNCRVRCKDPYGLNAVHDPDCDFGFVQELLREVKEQLE